MEMLSLCSFACGLALGQSIEASEDG